MKKTIFAICLLFAMPLHASERFNLEAYVRAFLGYDSSVFSQPRSDGDFLMIVNPTISGVTLLRIGELNFGFQPKINLAIQNFNDETIETIQQEAYLTLESIISEGFRTELSDAITSVSADLAKPRFHFGNSVTVNTLRADGFFVVPVSLRTDFTSSLRAARVDVFGFNDDRYQAGGFIGFTRELTRQLKAGLKARGEYVLYEDAVFENALVYGGDAFVDYGLRQNWSIYVPVGYQILDQGSSGQNSAIYADALLTGNFSEQTSLSLGFKSGFTFDAFGESFSRYGGTLEVTHDISLRMQISGEIALSTFEQTRTNIDPDAVGELNLSYGYDLSSKVKLLAKGGFFTNKGSFAENDFDQFSLYVGCEYSLLGQRSAVE